MNDLTFEYLQFQKKNREREKWGKKPSKTDNGYEFYKNNKNQQSANPRSSGNLKQNKYEKSIINKS